MVFKIGTSDVNYKQNMEDGSSNNNIYIGDSAIPKPKETVVQKAFNAAGNVIEGGSELLTAPAFWLKDMQKNWFGYMIIVAIILSTITFLYCVIQFYLRRKQTSESKTNLFQLATVLAAKTGNEMKQYPLSLSNLSSGAISSMGNLEV